jgi:23S rRNA pseudouridine1911/1915/1917 synthase
MTDATHTLGRQGEFKASPGITLAAALRTRMPDKSWRQVRELCSSGKVTVNGERVTEPAHRLAGGESLALNMSKPDPRRRVERPGFRVVFEDGHLIVIEKPEGVSTVPYERKESGTALDLIREAWRRQGKRATVTPLYTVHRIDKDTSGLVCFAKTKLAERGLHKIFKEHLAEREYVAVAQGQVRPGRIESQLIENRGDGLRGSARRFGVGSQPASPAANHRGKEWKPSQGFHLGVGSQPASPAANHRGKEWKPSQGFHLGEGQHAITDVEVTENLRGATLCRVRLRTGRTHQIRIHLSERGNPLVGETVYIRDLLRRGGNPIPSARLLLHAATLGFDHPVTGERLHFTAPLPPEFTAMVEKLRSATYAR